MVVERNRAVFTEAPTAVPDGNVDVSGGGRWKIWQNAGTKIDAPILGNGDLLAAVAGDGRYPQFWFTTNAHAHRLRGLEKTTDAGSGYSEEVGIIVM